VDLDLDLWVRVGSVTRRQGVLLCCLSALCFGLIGPIGVRAFAHGLSISTLIGWRFAIAAALLWLVVLVQRRPLVTGRGWWQPFLMGTVLYASQSAASFAALRRLPVGLTSLLLYTMPVMVVVVALLTGRERPRTRVFVALVLAVGGVGATVLGPADGRVSALGVVFDLTSAVLYTAYYFAMDSLPPGVDRLSAAALVCSGAGLSLVTAGLLTGGFDLTPGWPGLGWIVSMALICTVAAMSLLLVGIQVAGASAASVVSCLEPVTAVVLGALFFADPFGPAQAVGTAAVVAAVVILGAASPARPTAAPVQPAR
jgi:drug/metabolite transporter (DMT)-like permease